MTVYAWPGSLMCASMEWGLETNNLSSRSALTGSGQTVGLPTSRWVLTVNMPGQNRTRAGAVEAFFNSLVGGVDQVRVHRFDRPVPRGTMRGSPVLAEAAAQLANTLVIRGSTGVNLLKNPSFETTVAGTVPAANWTSYSSGTVNTRLWTQQTDTPAHGAKVLRAAAASTGTVQAKLGFYQQVLGLKPGRIYTLSGKVRYRTGVTPAANLELCCQISYRSITDAQLSFQQAVVPAGSTFADISLSFLSPPNAAQAYVYFYVNVPAITAASLSIDVDAADFREGSVPGFSPGGTLLAGDLIGVGSQLFQAADDSTFDAVGNTVVRTANRTRSSLAAAAALTWDKPTATFAVQDKASAFSFGPSFMGPSSFRLVEDY